MTSTTDWFSACVRLVVLIEGETPGSYADSVVVFRAKHWDDAFARALDLGRGLEKGYKNDDGRQVDWRLKEVLTLDQLGPTLVDGAEVYFRPEQLPPGESIAVEVVFDPSRSRPAQTGVPFRE